METYTIYYFIDETSIPFYVGLTKNFKRRTQRHKSEAFTNLRKLPKYYKLKKLLSKGIYISDIMIPQEIGLTKKQAISREIILIKKLRRQGIKLYNLTDGGEGCGNLTKEGKRRLRQSRLGYKHSPETRKKISEARIGMKFSKKHKENLSKARKKRITTQETRIRMSKSSKGKINIKIFILISPKGITYKTTEGLTKFCEEHGLTNQNIHKVIQGKRKHHKGWTALKSKE